MAAPSIARTQVPEKLAFLFEWGKWRYKVARGGRGGGKSRTIATALVWRGVETPLRWMCARETQKSLRFSSRQIIVDAIHREGLEAHYLILEDEIRGVEADENGRRTVFTFGGIRELNVDSLKSLEDFDGIWISEAHNLTEESWKKITPTFRRAGSEIWVDYNPEYEEDFIHRWSDNPPPNAKVVHVNYYDNPWFPHDLRVDMEHMQETDTAGYRHVWLGEAKNSVVGAVYGAELAEAYDQGRIVGSPGLGVDRTAPVDVFFDLGHGDAMAIWFAQMVNAWANILDFYQNEGEAIEHYVAVIEKKATDGRYRIGTWWLPWDGVSARTHHKLTGSNRRSPEQVLRSLGKQVRIAPMTDIDVGLSSVRTLFPQMRFDAERCGDGIKHLRMYQWGPKPEDGRVLTKPKHDGHSHAADALKTLAVCITEPFEDNEPSGWRPTPVGGGRTWMG